MNAEIDLPQIIHADRSLRFGLGRTDCREQQRGENGDDGNDHEHFDQ